MPLNHHCPPCCYLHYGLATNYSEFLPFVMASFLPKSVPSYHPAPPPPSPPFHSSPSQLCTLEFETRRASYYWLLEALSLYHPYVWEYARLNITHTVLSKRKVGSLLLLQIKNIRFKRASQVHKKRGHDQLWLMHYRHFSS